MELLFHRCTAELYPFLIAPLPDPFALSCASREVLASLFQDGLQQET